MSALDYELKRAADLQIPITLYMRKDGSFIARICKDKMYVEKGICSAETVKTVLNNYLRSCISKATI